MNYVQSWNDAVLASVQNLWSQVVAFIPLLFGALIVLILGLVLAALLSKLAKELVSYTKVDKLVEKMDTTKKMDQMGLKFSFSGVIGWVVKWFFILVTLTAVVDILRLTQITKFLNDVALYVPNVVVAVIILAIGMVVGQFVHDIVDKSTKASHVTAHTAHWLSSIAKWS